MLKLTDSPTAIRFVKDATAELLGKLGINSVADLLTHFPKYHVDTSLITKIGEIEQEGEYTLRGQIHGFRNVFTKSRKQLQTAKLEDDSGMIDLTWFNQPFLSKTFRSSHEVYLHGQVKFTGGKATMLSPEYEMVGNKPSVHLARISPVYALTRGISLKWLRRWMLDALQSVDKTALISPLDSNFDINLATALQQIHFPTDLNEVDQSSRRLAIEELTSILLRIIKERANTVKLPGISAKAEAELLTKFLSLLPFELTPDQATVIEEITTDLSTDTGMYRLLQGDVGSGKTVVAAAASLITIASGFQVALLAPTVILAEQHFQTLTKLLKDLPIKIGLVTGTQKTGDEQYDIFVGTSAILSRKEKLFTKLGLVIVDEQHRFGVNQREALKELWANTQELVPNVLDMTATPIPRTIALTFFGDMELSTIKTKPVGRLPINTKIVPKDKREDSHKWISEQVATGRQVYWVCSLVEESELLEIKSAKTTFTELQTKIFPQHKIGLIHGKLKDKEKIAVMRDFEDGKIDILVSTTVIEVGIDVPNATIMVIEDADRLGLAQLHQIRGRVGRSSLQSWCFIYESPDISDIGRDRLRFFATHNDGLEIAEYDLNLRGPGEVYGTRQAGIPNLRIAKLNDLKLITQAKELAQELYKKDPETKLPLFN